MTQAGSTEQVKIEGRNWRLDPRQDVAVRELKPGQLPSGKATHLTPHSNDGKRKAGWRLEWIVFFAIFLVLLGCLGAGVAAAAI